MSPAMKRVESGSRITATLLCLAAASAVLFWIGAALPYVTTHRESFGEHPEIFWDRRYALWMHILGGSLAMFSGPIQIWLGETRRRLPLHRTLGTAYLAGVAIMCLAAFYLSLTSPVGLIFASGLFAMATAASVATSMAYAAILHRNFVQHREWMIRSYVVVLSFVFFRAIVVVLAMQGIGGTGQPGDLVRLSVAAWSSWALPLMITEMFLQLPKLKRSSQSFR